jgi:hypothetical protein
MANPTPPSNTPTVTTNYQSPPTLVKIQQKTRRITRTPSEAQLSTALLNDYINTAIEYDIPERLRTFNLNTDFTFYTNPGQDVYNTDEASFAGASNNPLYNFQNKYLTINPPFYIAGFESHYFQTQNNFFSAYPKVNSIQLQALGNGTPGPFTGVVNSQQAIIPPGLTQAISLLQNNVVFNAIGIPGTSEEVGMALQDVPVVDPATGYKLNFGNLYDVNSTTYQAALTTPPTTVISGNNINYLTGAFTITFPQNTVAETPINSLTVPQNTALPQSVMFFSNYFTLRPVPDQSYPVTFEVRQRPVALLTDSQVPELEEMWQYIAYLAAKKIFEDRMDLDSVQQIMPELRNQENFCLRRTLVQNSTQRATTIYADQNSNSNNGNNGGWGNGWSAW